MTLLDANLLLYAYNADAPEQPRAAAWLEQLLDGTEVIGLPWSTLWAFLRIATSARIWRNPKSAQEAFEIMRGWLAQPGVLIVQPGARHAELLEALVREHRATGPLLSDAVLAALALENGAVLASSDRDFSRFPGLRWINPLA